MRCRILRNELDDSRAEAAAAAGRRRDAEAAQIGARDGPRDDDAGGDRVRAGGEPRGELSRNLPPAVCN